MIEITVAGEEPMRTYAQTNLQLLNQLIAVGYPEADLQCVFTAYQLAMELFTGRFRASGKPFLAHLVGTASILGDLAVPIPLVVAGLLHSAYSHGDFGPLSREAKSKRIRQAIGEEANAYLVRYDNLTWKPHTIPELHQQLSRLKSETQGVILMRLANELEEHYDLGLLYCGNPNRHQQSRHQCAPIMVEMAHQLGFPTLAGNLSEAFQRTATAQIPANLTNPTGERYTTLVVPHSCRQRLAVRFHQSVSARLRFWARA